MDASVIEELRLSSFKSFHGARIPLSELTLLIGRNGAGKSNVLDALEVLSRLATGDDVRDALDGGRRDAGSVRGGAEGCAPRGQQTFALGCTVRTGRDRVSLDVEIQVEPQVQIIREVLVGPARYGQKPLIETAAADPERSDIRATWWNGVQGPNPSLVFRASRLLTSQVATRVPGTSAAGRAVHRAADQMLAALRGVFHLDPVPHLMRQYVHERDVVLRRTAENLSAVVRDMQQHDKEAFRRLVDLLGTLPEHEVGELVVERSTFGDVMLAIHERQAGGPVVIPARLMSDGMLRFLAVATALLSATKPREPDPGVAAEAVGGRTLVVEELENGLHPSQAAKVLELLVEEGRERQVHTLATTHSPALLSALAGEDHDSVFVCDRDPESGLSRVRALTNLPGYAKAMATGSLGEAVTRRLLTADPRETAKARRDFELLIGLG